MKRYLLVVGALTPSIVNALNYILDNKLHEEVEVILMARDINYSLRVIDRHGPKFKIQINKTTFSEEEIASIVKPLKGQIIGVCCRSDKHVQDLRKVVPHLDKSVFVASVQALTIATNKRLMREAFYNHAPSITPKHIRISSDGKQTIDEVEKTLSYPVIVKPTNLASSLLIQSCDNRTELQAALTKIFNVIYGIYRQEERFDPPEVIVEEYLEGDFYSIDAYALDNDQVYVCPPVSYIPAKQIGIDDFFLFKRSMPAKLSNSEIEAANEAVKESVRAVGLSYCTAHVELVLTKNGWRIIELGPRLGRFRHRMYGLSYAIDHSLNDVKLHLGLKPEIPTKLIQYSAAYSIYPDHEGTLVSIVGLDKVIDNPGLKWHKVHVENGIKAHFAKNGGHSLAELVIACEDETEFLKLCKLIENEVYAKID